MLRTCHYCGAVIWGSGIEGVYYDGNYHVICYKCFKKRKKKPFQLPET